MWEERFRFGLKKWLVTPRFLASPSTWFLFVCSFYHWEPRTPHRPPPPSSEKKEKICAFPVLWSRSQCVFWTETSLFLEQEGVWCSVSYGKCCRFTLFLPLKGDVDIILCHNVPYDSCEIVFFMTDLFCLYLESNFMFGESKCYQKVRFWGSCRPSDGFRRLRVRENIGSLSNFTLCGYVLHSFETFCQFRVFNSLSSQAVFARPFSWRLCIFFARWVPILVLVSDRVRVLEAVCGREEWGVRPWGC